MLASVRAFRICGRLAAGCAFATAFAFVVSPSACLLTVPLDGLDDGQKDAAVATGGSSGTNGCAPGFADCDLKSNTGLNGCETKIQTDKANCGTCSHDCLGATCTDYACDPTEIYNDVGQLPVSLALDASKIFWTDKGAVSSHSKNGAEAPVKIATGESGALRLALDDSYVYWTNSGGKVQKLSKSGGSSTILDSGASGLRGIAADATNVFWVTTSSIMKSAKTAGSKSELVSGEQAPTEIVVAQGKLFWIASVDNSVKTATTDGTGVTPIATQLLYPVAIAVDATNVYIAERGSDAGGFNDGKISRVGVGGGPKEEIATGQAAPESIALFNGYVYWTNFNGLTVNKMQIPASGQKGDINVIAINQFGAKAVVVDESSAYWISGDKILRVAR